MGNYSCTADFSSLQLIYLARSEWFIMWSITTLFDPSKVYTHLLIFFNKTRVEKKKKKNSLDFNTFDPSSRYFQLFQFYASFG